MFVMNSAASEEITSFSKKEDFSCIFGLDGMEDTVKWQNEKITEICVKNSADVCETLSELQGKLLRRSLQDMNSYKYDGIIIKIISTRSGSLSLFDELNGEKNTIRDLNPEIMLQPGCGIMHFRIPAISGIAENDQKLISGFISDLRFEAEKTGGSLILEKAPAWLKKEISAWGEFKGLSLMRRIKQKYDPNNILNPYRYI